MNTFRTILSSGRDVTTIEEETEFWVRHEGPCIHGSVPVSGPFPLDDSRFSEVKPTERIAAYEAAK
jgi:hypothetical protein